MARITGPKGTGGFIGVTVYYYGKNPRENQRKRPP
jgi:hypothetical protein